MGPSGGSVDMDCYQTHSQIGSQNWGGNGKWITLEKNSKIKGFLEKFSLARQRRVVYRQDGDWFFSQQQPLGSVIKTVLGAWEFSVMVASSISAAVSLTVLPQWHDMLSLPWWYPAGKFSECSLDWHYLFFGTDLVSQLIFWADFHRQWEAVQNLQIDIASLWTYGLGFQLPLHTKLAYL